MSDVKVGDRVSLYELARSIEFTGETPWDKIGRVSHVHRGLHASGPPSMVDVVLEPRYAEPAGDRYNVQRVVHDETGDVTVAVRGVPVDELDVIEPPVVVLTPAQIRALLVGPWSEGFSLPPEKGLAITTQDEKGWIMVEDAQTLGEAGGGVWMDTGGCVWYGPTGSDWEKQQMADPKDYTPVELVSKREPHQSEPIAPGGVLIVADGEVIE